MLGFILLQCKLCCQHSHIEYYDYIYFLGCLSSPELLMFPPNPFFFLLLCLVSRCPPQFIPNPPPGDEVIRQPFCFLIFFETSIQEPSLYFYNVVLHGIKKQYYFKIFQMKKSTRVVQRTLCAFYQDTPLTFHQLCPWWASWYNLNVNVVSITPESDWPSIPVLSLQSPSAYDGSSVLPWVPHSWCFEDNMTIILQNVAQFVFVYFLAVMPRWWILGRNIRGVMLCFLILPCRCHITCICWPWWC